MPTLPGTFESNWDESDDSRLKLQWKICDERIAQWMHRADLARISGQGGMFLPVLKYAGIATVRELADCDPSNFMARIRKFNPGEKAAHPVPSEPQIAKWIERARLMVMTEC